MINNEKLAKNIGNIKSMIRKILAMGEQRIRRFKVSYSLSNNSTLKFLDNLKDILWHRADNNENKIRDWSGIKFINEAMRKRWQKVV